MSKVVAAGHPTEHIKEVRVDAVIGIDVSKENLDVCLLVIGDKRPRFKTFCNEPKGYQALLNWTREHSQAMSRHFCLEATGPYSLGVATFLAEADETVSVVNPRRVKHAGISQGVGNKTDHADARLLADYCRKEDPPPFRLCAPEMRELTALMRRIEALEIHRDREKNRLEDPHLPKLVTTSIKESVTFCDKAITKLTRKVEQHIDNHPDLKADRDLLVSIPGIGDKLAQWILAELPAMDSFTSAQQVAAFAGLAPCEYQSGSSVKRRTRISKAGNARLRHWLFMPAQSARMHNPLVKALFDRLVERGLAPKAAVIACMRKLLMLAYGVLRSRIPFQLDYAQNRRQRADLKPA